MPEDDLSTGTVDSALADSVGGVFDLYGTTRRLPRRQQFTQRGLYVRGAGDRVRVTSQGDRRVTDTGDVRVLGTNLLTDLQVQTDALKGKIGARGILWRRRLHDGARSWKEARLLHVEHVETIEEANVVSDVESLFETHMAGWRAATATETTLEFADGVGAGLIHANAGTLPALDAVITVAVTSGTVTQVHIEGTTVELTWTGTLEVGETLTIDAGEEDVTLDGDDAYSGFTLGAGHVVDSWLPLDIGTNLLTVTVTGGDADVTLSHYDQSS